MSDWQDVFRFLDLPAGMEFLAHPTSLMLIASAELRNRIYHYAASPLDRCVHPYMPPTLRMSLSEANGRRRTSLSTLTMSRSG
jgi:hypothetical protein